MSLAQSSADRAEQLRADIEELRRVLSEKEAELEVINDEELMVCLCEQDDSPSSSQVLSRNDIARYSRQIILPEIGVAGQLKLKNASVLVVGVGGLGCPSSLYLVGAGVGRIGLVDYDLVEISNLHRQVLHTESSIQTSKVESAKAVLQQLNSTIRIDTYKEQLNSTNALDILRPYDLVLDATDNVATRYLLNDACVMLGKPLVSGSALQLEGQLTVYNHINGPCYRCIFPVPPPPETVTNCGDGGILGAVVGVIGTLQALEAIKILLNHEGVLSGKLLLFDAARTAFRTIKLRGKRDKCDVCSPNPIVTQLIDYEEFCGMRANDKESQIDLLDDEERVSVHDLDDALSSTTNQPLLLIDVRSPNEFEICSLPRSLNVPIRSILDDRINPQVRQLLIATTEPIYVVCRRGNDSQLAVKRLQALCEKSAPRDVIGGLHAWTHCIDPMFPMY